MEKNKDRRLLLHSQLCNIIEPYINDGDSHVYFQPPESLKIKFPCIIYSFDRYQTEFADNDIYNNRNVYRITVVDKNPDSEIPKELLKLKYCLSSGFFISDGLNHWNFTIIF